MSSLSEFWRKQRSRLYARGIPRSHQLRQRFAYEIARHGFEVGDFSIGAPTVHRFDGTSRLRIGRYCSIAAGATFILGGDHKTHHVTTFPLGLPARNLKAVDLPLSRGDIVIGSDVWIAANATVISGVTVGDGAVVGAGSVVIHDVPPYAIVFGNPARVIAKRFPDDVVAELMNLRWWDLDPEQVRSLQPLLQSSDVPAFLAACRKLKGLPPIAQAQPRACTSPAKESAGDVAHRGAPSRDVLALIRGEIPGLSSDDLDTPFERLEIDSFGMLTLRTRIEQAFAATIDDESWTSVVTPADVMRIVSRMAARKEAPSPSGPATQRRVYELNMPQMALGGLSESWLFKEIGDLHWSLITTGLHTPSSRLADASGNRLYATFTRFQLSSTAPLAAYRENERITIEGKASRYGAGMFFSNVTVAGDARSARARVMSSFSRYGEAGANTSLLKGQPEIPDTCDIPCLADLPEFAQDYRARRAQQLAAPLFECEYDIIAPHDINGVGLLYFAAYPIINDICATRYAGRAFATASSTRDRDVFYFANSDPDETLLFRLHRWEASDGAVTMEASLSRKSDGAPMAYVLTSKERIAK
jgi:probable biosynthetic protein (TIGR04098 family)